MYGMDVKTPSQGMSAIYLKELRRRFRSELSPEYPHPEIDAIFYELIAHYFGFPRTVIAMEPATQLSKAEASLLSRALDGLKAHRPVQHIIGQAYFMDMTLRVSPDVLIPRPETAELVTWVSAQFSPENDTPFILDVGTGSGCIALGLKQYLPHAVVHGIDISDAALEIARYNSAAQDLEVQFYKGDLFKARIHNCIHSTYSYPIRPIFPKANPGACRHMSVVLNRIWHYLYPRKIPCFTIVTFVIMPG